MHAYICSSVCIHVHECVYTYLCIPIYIYVYIHAYQAVVQRMGGIAPCDDT